VLKSWLTPIVGPLIGVLLGASLVTVVGAQGGNSDQIHACVRSRDGRVRIVDASQSCRKNETALAWNIQGPPGPPGPAGPAGVSGYEIVVAPETLDVSQAFCPPGKVVLGGGGTVETDALLESIPIRGQQASILGWQVVTAGLGSTRQARAQAICATPAP
jgi:hypothetical protein